MSRRKIPEDIQEQVRQRSRYLCEYCHASEQWQYVRFTVDHVVPIALGGTDDWSNLALACFHCNRKKGDRVNVTSESGESIALFNPRQDSWQEHFIWSVDGLSIVGLTPTGNATIDRI